MSEYRPYDQIILFGDSITQGSSSQERGFGFHAALQHAYIRKLDVINRGFGGYTTAHAIRIYPQFFPTPETARVRFLTIFFGANDACLPGNPQHVPLEVYKENLRALIQHPATVAQNPRILLLTPTPVDEYQLAEFDESKGNTPLTRTASNTKVYADAAREVGRELGVAVTDLWGAFMAVAGWRDGQGQPLAGSREVERNEKLEGLFTDGLHLSPDGYRVVFAEVMKTIRANWEDQEPEKLPMVYPAWADMSR